MYHTLPSVSICSLQRPEQFHPYLFGALVPRLTSEVRRGTCLGQISLLFSSGQTSLKNLDCERHEFVELFQSEELVLKINSDEVKELFE